MDVERNDVFLDAVNHVIVGALEHHLEVVLILDHGQLILCSHYVVGAAEQSILYLVLFLALLLKFFLFQQL